MRTGIDISRRKKGFLEVIFLEQFDKAKSLIPGLREDKLISKEGAITLADVFTELFERCFSAFTLYSQENWLESPEHQQYQKSYRGVIDLLIEAQAGIHAQNKLGETALGVAIKLQDESLVSYLLEKKADPRCVNKDGDTALHIANNSVKLLPNQKPNINIIKMLLDAKVDPSQENQQGERAITVALRDKNRTEEIVNIQISAYNESKFNPLKEKVFTAFNETSWYYPDLINIIFLYAVELVESSPLKDQQEVYEAVKKNDLQALKRLMDQGVDTDDIRGIEKARREKVYTSLEFAAKRMISLEVVSMLLSHNYKRQALGTDGEDVAAGLRALLGGLEGSVEVDQRQSVLAFVELFLKYPGININSQGKNGCTVLMQAVNLNWKRKPSFSSKKVIHPILDLLLKIKPDLDRQDDWGNTAMILAAQSLRNGREFNSTYCLIEQLIENKADVNIQNRWGETALTELIRGRYKAGVELLLKNKADPFLRDENEENAYEIAKRTLEGEIAELISRYAPEKLPPADKKGQDQDTLPKEQKPYDLVAGMLCDASEEMGSVIPAEDSESPRKNNQTPKKGDENGEIKPETAQGIKPLAGSTGLDSKPTSGLSISGMFQNNPGKKEGEPQLNTMNVSDKPSSPSTPSKAK